MANQLIFVLEISAGFNAPWAVGWLMYLMPGHTIAGKYLRPLYIVRGLAPSVVKTFMIENVFINLSFITALTLHCFAVWNQLYFTPSVAVSCKNLLAILFLQLTKHTMRVKNINRLWKKKYYKYIGTRYCYFKSLKVLVIFNVSWWICGVNSSSYV